MYMSAAAERRLLLSRSSRACDEGEMRKRRLVMKRNARLALGGCSVTSKENPALRTIGNVASYALAIVLTLLVPASAQVSDFITVDVPGASATLPRGINAQGDIVGFYGAG